METELVLEAAHNALSGVVNDFLESTYLQLKGSLGFTWSDNPTIGARAYSRGGINEPPHHEITISHKLARDLYRDAESCYGFMRSEHHQESLQAMFPELSTTLATLNSMERKVAINNMFMASLTWVFFHELGHCMQEHKYIRQKYCTVHESGQIYELGIPASPLSQIDATIYHVTEFAADAEATYWCICELVRHFLAPYITDECGDLLSPDKIDFRDTCFSEFRANLYLFVCGVSIAFCRFHGRRDLSLTPLPVSSHPLPQRRLEMILPQIWEKLDLRSNYLRLHDISRHELVHIGIGASTGSCLSWLQDVKSTINSDIFLPQGVLQDPYLRSYWPTIVQAWDQIESDVRCIRRFGPSLGLLGFTNELRLAIGLPARG